MKIEQVNSLIRTVMSLVGAFLFGGGLHKLFGQVIDTAYWEQITGVVLTIVSIVWSISTKMVDIEKLQGAVRQVITFICGVLMANGIINEQTMLAIIAFVAAIIPYIQAGLSRKKADQLQQGVISVHELKATPKK